MTHPSLSKAGVASRGPGLLIRRQLALFFVYWAMKLDIEVVLIAAKTLMIHAGQMALEELVRQGVVVVEDEPWSNRKTLN